MKKASWYRKYNDSNCVVGVVFSLAKLICCLLDVDGSLREVDAKVKRAHRCCFDRFMLKLTLYNSVACCGRQYDMKQCAMSAVLHRAREISQRETQRQRTPTHSVTRSNRTLLAVRSCCLMFLSIDKFVFNFFPDSVRLRLAAHVCADTSSIWASKARRSTSTHSLVRACVLYQHQHNTTTEHETRSKQR
jgi:hypothetical protein